MNVPEVININSRLLPKMGFFRFPTSYWNWKTIIFVSIAFFFLQEVSAKPPRAAALLNTLEDQNQALPKTKSLLPTTEFRYETESHRLRIPRYMAYLLENEAFLNQFPEYRVLVPEFDKVIAAANAHDIEKEPKRIYTKLAHDKGVNYDKLPPEEAKKAKAFRAAFNADGEEKIKRVLKAQGFIDETGEINQKGKLFFTLEAFVDRWDAYKFRAQEFGKKMLRPGDYIRQVLKPSGFTTDHYSVDKVAAMDDFVTTEQNKVNLEKAVGRVTPQAYKRVRNHFRGNDPSFAEIQREQATKIVSEHSQKINEKMGTKKLLKASNPVKAVKSSPSRLAASKIMNGVVYLGTAGAAASALHETTDPKKETGEALNSATISAWNIGSAFMTAGATQISSLGDDMADRYADKKVYEDFLSLPLEEQEMIFRNNNTLPFRTVIFSKRPRITEMKCSSKSGHATVAQSEPLEFEVYTPERQRIRMKLFFDDNKPMYLIGKSASSSSSDDSEIRLSLQSQQACFALPQFSREQRTLITKNKCTTVNAKGLPDLEPEMAQHLSPDYWGEMVKTHEWATKYFSLLQNCCNSDKCLKVMNDTKYLNSLATEKGQTKKLESPDKGRH